jgi:hypothetical protein
MNQFSARQDLEGAGLYAQYMTRGARRNHVLDLVRAVTEQPTLCRLPEYGDYVYLRAGNKQHKIAVRSLVYYAINNTLPVFGPCTCKNRGCVTPAHQNLVEK